MKKRYIIAILVTGGLAAAGYWLYQYLNQQKKLIEDYSISLLRIQFSSFSEDLISAYFTLRITNKSAIEATVEKVYADVYLNDAYVGNVINDGSFAIPAKGSSDVKLKFTFANKEFLKNIVSTVLKLVTTNDVPYRLNGSVKLKSGGLISLSVPFDYSGGIKSDMLT